MADLEGVKVAKDYHVDVPLQITMASMLKEQTTWTGE